MGAGDLQEARARFFALSAAAVASSAAGNVTASAAGDSSSGGPVSVSSITITLLPGEAIVLPFILVSFDAGEILPSQALSTEAKVSGSGGPASKGDGLEARPMQVPAAALLRTATAAAFGAESSAASSNSMIVAMPSAAGSGLIGASQDSTFEAAAALQPASTPAAASSAEAEPSLSSLGLIPTKLGPELATSPFQRRAEVTITAKHSEVTAALLRVDISPTPLIGLSRTLVFFFGQGQYCRGVLPLPPVPAFPGQGADGSEGSFVKIPETDRVVASVTSPPVNAAATTPASALESAWLQRLLKFRYSLSSPSSPTSAASPSGGMGCFHVCLYNDGFGASLNEVWRVLVLPLQPLSVHCLVGQTSTVDVLVRGSGNAASDSVQLVTSHPSELTFAPPAGDKPFFLPAMLTRLRFNVTPSFAASAQASRKHAVFLLDSNTKAIQQGWWVSASSSLPAISRAYQIPLRVGQRADKRIPYTNEFAEPRGYKVLTSDPQLVTIKGSGNTHAGEGGAAGSDEMIVPAHSRGMIRLSIGPIHALGRAEVLLFVNDSSTGANEDCLLLQVDVGV
jgi:hypothetical protein